MDNYSLLEGLGFSAFAVVIVFLILVLLAVLISLLRFLPSTEEDKKQNQAALRPIPAGPIGQKLADDEERMVAMLAASCIAKDEIKQDVRVISIERTK